MVEIQPIPLSPNKLALTLHSPNELMKRNEFAPVFSWYKEQCRQLPEMKVTAAPLTDGTSWKASKAPNGEVEKINNTFFSVEGIDVSTPALSWHQGALVQRTELLPTKQSEKTPVSGVVIMLTNPKNETFVTVTQEPLVPVQYRGQNGEFSTRRSAHATEIHPIVRSAIQTSVEKLQKIAANETDGARYDQQLFTLLRTIAKNKNISIMDLVSSVPLSKAPTDGNRIVSNVVYGNIAVTESQSAEIAHALPQGKWCSQKEIDALITAGMTNGHLSVAKSITEAQRRLA